MEKIIYIRDENNFPVGCFAYKINRDADKPSIEYGLSIHHPNDKFNKKIAREIALGRLRTKHEVMVFDVEDAHVNDVVHDVFLELETAKSYLDNRLSNRVLDALDNMRHRLISRVTA